MSSKLPLSLDAKIANLSDRLDPVLRSELKISLSTLRNADKPDPFGTVVRLERLSLKLLTKILEASGHKMPSANLYNCLTYAGRGDPSSKTTGLKLLPDEIETALHPIRVWSGKNKHDLEKVSLNVSDAETALHLYLRVLEWYYTEYDKGPRLQTIYSPVSLVTGRRASVRSAVYALIVIAGALLLTKILPRFSSTVSALSPSSKNTSIWQVYRPADGSYVIEFKGKPQELSAQNAVMSHYAGVTYAVYSTNITGTIASTSDEQAYLTKQLTHIAQAFPSNDGSIVELPTSNSSTLDGCPAKRFSIHRPQNECTGLLVLALGRLYEVTAVGKGLASHSMEIRHFLDSFHPKFSADHTPLPASSVSSEPGIVPTQLDTLTKTTAPVQHIKIQVRPLARKVIDRREIP